MEAFNLDHFRRDLRAFPETTGKSFRWLAGQIKRSQPCLSEFAAGRRSSIGADIVELVWPYLYGDKRPPGKSKEASSSLA